MLFLISPFRVSFTVVDAAGNMVICWAAPTVLIITRRRNDRTFKIAQSEEPPCGATEPPDSGSLQPVPNIKYITPSSGPICGGIEVSVIGSGFSDDCRCAFGGSIAATIQQTEILCLCILPPRETPGPVTVHFEGVSFMGATKTFTYIDTRENEAYVYSVMHIFDL